MSHKIKMVNDGDWDEVADIEDWLEEHCTGGEWFCLGGDPSTVYEVTTYTTYAWHEVIDE